VPGEEDAATLQRILDLSDDEAVTCAGLDTPAAVIQQLGACRVLIAGSYHAAVFALASGIPTIGLVRADYYRDKFLGLAAMFRAGCRVIDLDDPHLGEHLEETTVEMWHAGDDLRQGLREAAREQLHLSRSAYARLPDLLRTQP
jgi:polysaccharide pyruvyl transferase WcaK-like protein